MCKNTLEEDFPNLEYLSDCYVVQEMCNDAVEEQLHLLELNPEHF